MSQKITWQGTTKNFQEVNAWGHHDVGILYVQLFKPYVPCQV